MDQRRPNTSLESFCIVENRVRKPVRVAPQRDQFRSAFGDEKTDLTPTSDHS